MKCIFCNRETEKYIETKEGEIQADYYLCINCIEKLLFFKNIRIEFNHDLIKKIIENQTNLK